MRSRFFLLASIAATVAACGREGEADAYGTFEAIEVLVSSQTAGQIQTFVPVEGARLASGDDVVQVDTLPLTLERAQLIAQRQAARSRNAEADRQIAVLNAQLAVAQRSYERAQRLFAQQATTAQQLDQAERDYRVLLAQVELTRAQRRSVELDAAAIDARVAQVEDRISRSLVRNPQGGTVLKVYARAGEVVEPGQPLYRIAALDTLLLRAYVSETQLALVSLGQAVTVNMDGGGGLVGIPGEVAWISDKAEFTPTPVQTRDERADLVYAMTIRVPNPEGALKIGMPGDVTFAATR